MFREKEISDYHHEGDNSHSKSSQLRISEKPQDNPDEKNSFPHKGIDFLKVSQVGFDGFLTKSSKPGTSGSQELTLRYLCENPKLGFLENDVSRKITMENLTLKGKEIVISENSNQDEKWVERDFLNLNETRGNSSKREVEDDIEVREDVNREKKQRLETLNLSLALPDVSLSLTASNALQNADPVMKLKPNRSTTQSMAPSNNNTQTTYSNDFTAASLSYSYSHPFSHNPSCSMTRNSTENYDCSVGRDDQIWCGGEGTNGSVHSRFKPIGDGVSLSNHGGGFFSNMQVNRPVNKDSGNNNNINNNNSIYKTNSSDSFFPSELPAKPRIDNYSGDSRKKDSENLRGMEGIDAGRARKVSRPERFLLEVVSESVPVMAVMIQEIPDETLESIKEYLRNITTSPQKKEELLAFQTRLERRSDLNKETLSKCHKNQLNILVTIRTGQKHFLSEKLVIPMNELVEIFLFMRCKNVNCKSLLPVEDCDCKICSGNKGFCSSCMCPVCLNFDCANNTCSWVGCDVCSHWCHAACGIEKNLIKSGPSLKGPAGTTEVQFHCIGCGHASEMFGFVKDVFICCAKDWGLEILIKELDCVRKIFKGSDDFKGKELHIKADDMVKKLETKLMSPSDACNFIIEFFNYTDYMPDFPASVIPPKDVMATQALLISRDEASVTPPKSLPPKYSAYSTGSSSARNDMRQKDLKATLLMSDRKLEDDDAGKLRNLSKNDGFDSLESMIRIKDAEGRMFQSKADEARSEAEQCKREIRAMADRLEEEYTERLAKLCLKDTEETRKKKLEELKVLENSHCDYKNMKLRMQADIAGLLERMESTRQQLV